MCVTVISSTTISCLHKKANFPSRLSCDVFFSCNNIWRRLHSFPCGIYLSLSLSYVPFIVIVIIFFPSLTFLFLNELLFISIQKNISKCYKNFHTTYKPIGKFGNFSHTCHQQIYFVDACCSSFDICFKIELFWGFKLSFPRLPI